MRAELPLVITAPTRTKHLSAAGIRNLIEGAVRATDLLVVLGTGLLVGLWRPSGGPMSGAGLVSLFLGVVLSANFFGLAKLYHADRLTQLTFQIPRILVAWAATATAITTVLFGLQVAHEVSRLWMGFWFLAAALTLIATRIGIRLWLAHTVTATTLVRRVAVIGIGEQLKTTLPRLTRADPSMTVTAILDLDSGLIDRWPTGVSTLQGFADLEDRIVTGQIDHVILALPAGASALLERTIANLRHLSVDVAWIPELPGVGVPVLDVSHAGGIPLVQLHERPLDGWSYVVKSIEDRLLSIVLLVFLSPLLLLIALAIKLDSPGPIFFRQKRHGFSREPILMFKFRSMYVNMCDAPDAKQFRQATRDDPRITRVGKCIRRTSLDELPQLLNVVAGDMSLVGPRPHPLALNEQYKDKIDGYLSRHRMKPGITGWAQVNGYRGETVNDEDMRLRVQHDLYYIHNWSILLDLRILALTIIRGFVHRNAF